MSLTKVTNSMIEGSPINVLDYGAVGDWNGTTGTDDTAAFNAAFAAAYAFSATNGSFGTVYVPEKAYKITGRILAQANAHFEIGASLHPVGMAAGQIVYYVSQRTTHENVKIIGDPAVDPANGTIGIKVGDTVAEAGGTAGAASRSRFLQCFATKLAYGAVVATFSTKWMNCWIRANTTNVSIYAPAGNEEINDTFFSGGNYGGALGDYAFNIGDPSFASTNTGSYGNTLLFQGFACDQGSFKVDKAISVALRSLYFENPSNGKCIIVGTDGESSTVQNLTIENCQFRTADYAVYCEVESRDFSMAQNNFSAISYCALYVPSDIYAYSYQAGSSTSSFTLAPEVHTGQRNTTLPSFSSYTNISQGITKGRQFTATTNSDGILPNALLDDGSTLKVETATNLGRVYPSPTTGITGDQVGNDFTFATPSQTKFFNAGDAIVRSTGADTHVLSVNYAGGTMRLKISQTVAGITVGQIASVPSASIV